MSPVAMPGLCSKPRCCSYLFGVSSLSSCHLSHETARSSITFQMSFLFKQDYREGHDGWNWLYFTNIIQSQGDRQVSQFVGKMGQTQVQSLLVLYHLVVLQQIIGLWLHV